MREAALAARRAFCKNIRSTCVAAGFTAKLINLSDPENVRPRCEPQRQSNPSCDGILLHSLWFWHFVLELIKVGRTHTAASRERCPRQSDVSWMRRNYDPERTFFLSCSSTCITAFAKRLRIFQR